MTTRGFIAFDYKGTRYKMLRFQTGDKGEGLALLAPPKYSRVKGKRCVLQKFTPKTRQENVHRFTITDMDSVTSLGGVYLKFDFNPDSMQCMEVQAKTDDIKMNWHGDGNFHISGSGLPNRRKNLFTSTAVEAHFGVPAPGADGVDRIEALGLLLGMIFVKSVKDFFHSDNIMKSDEAAICHLVKDIDKIRPLVIFLCRIRMESGVTLKPVVVELFEDGLKDAIANTVKQVFLGGEQRKLEIDESSVHVFGVQDSISDKTFFVFYACHLMQEIQPGREEGDWHIVSAQGADDVILKLTVKSKSAWWPEV